MVPAYSVVLSNERPRISRRFLIAFASIYIIGICMKPLPFISASPLPVFLKSNGMLLSILLIIFASIHSRGSFLSVCDAKAFFPFVLYGALATAIMSLVLFEPLGSLYGESTISATLPSYLWLSMMMLTLLALNYIFDLAGAEVLDVVFEVFTLLVVIVGLVQIFDVVTGIPLYQPFSSSGVFQKIFDGRISTIGTEPSSNGGIVCMLALPFALSKVMSGSHWRFKLYSVLLVLLIFYISSSQCYIAFLALAAGFCFVYRERMLGHKSLFFISVVGMICCTAFLYISITGVDILASEPVQNLRYFIFEKAFDQTNGSTVNRSSTLINDLCVFLKFPLFGCGEGIQGFFFNENIALHGMAGNSEELANLLMGKAGVVGPGCFITAILSSFGIAGMFLFLRALFKSLLEAKACRTKLGGYFEMVTMSLFAAIPMGFIGISFAGSWLTYVILALACMRSRRA